MIEMKDVQLASYSNELSDASDATGEEDKDFAITDLLSFSWQIAKGMVCFFMLVIPCFNTRIHMKVAKKINKHWRESRDTKSLKQTHLAELLF